jgi:hypothetical protein
MAQPKPKRSMRVKEFLREPGLQIVRADLLMSSTIVSKIQIDEVLDALDEDNIPILKVVWYPDYGRFLPLNPNESALLAALSASGREYLKVEVVGDPVLAEKWLIEEEATETALPMEEEE